MEKQERRQESTRKKREWYKQSGFQSVLFIPPTTGGKLKRLYQQKIVESGIKIKTIEKTGIKLKDIVQKTDPFKPPRCIKEDCFPCNSGNKQNCLKESITYRINVETNLYTEKHLQWRKFVQWIHAWKRTS